VLPVPPETELGWMRHFVGLLADGWTRDMLMSALDQPAPDLRFEDALGYFPEDRLLWIVSRNARMAAVISTWLDANEIQPTSEPPIRYR
jgi:hypothetical protein